MLRRLLLLALVTAVLSLAGPTAAAHAGGRCPGGTTSVSTTASEICVVVHESAGQGSSGKSASTPSNGGDKRPPGCYKSSGEQVPCATEMGVWFGGHQCYASPYSAPAASPAWQGHSNGSLSLCSKCVASARANTCTAQVLWLAPGAAPGPPDPAQMASDALGLLRLPAAQLRTAPQAPLHTYVGIENWLWVPKSQWETLTKTVTAGGTRVRVKAAPSRVVWDMGPASETCYGPGVEWRVGMTDAARTSCGFTYAHISDFEPHGVYSLAATIRYQVDWVCSGACTRSSGTLGLVDAPSGTGTLRVLQRQTVVVG